ncbi:ATP-binding protein [Stenotrophomonas sp.]|uniref:ATP-binding protein n=1 Tax=Stenotrophomonas sp. TaxID=69392 RepID=UPI00289881AD|nr:ATP-binding protein [Stenotrophomonas sp.]
MFNALRRLYAPLPSRGNAAQQDVMALHRHHRRILVAGGSLLSLVIALGMLAAIAMHVERYHDERKAAFGRAAAALNTALAQRDVDLARLQNMAEYAWRHPPEVWTSSFDSDDPATTFLRQHERDLANAGADSVPQMVLGRGTAGWERVRLQRYLRFATALSIIMSVSSTDPQQAAAEPAFFHDARGRLLVLNQGLTEAHLTRSLHVDTRDALFQRLIAYGQLAPPTHSGHTIPGLHPSREGARVRRGIAAHPVNGQLSLVSAFSVLDGDTNVGTFVAFEPIARLAPLLGGSDDGHLMVVAPNGRVLMGSRPATAPIPLDALHAAGLWTPERAALTRHSRDGRYYIANLVHDTDWSLVDVYTWQDILRDGGWNMAAMVALGLGLIAGVWLLLVRLDRRVLAPLIARAVHVYQSEAVNRALIEMSPVGLCLIDIERNRPVLENEQVRSYAAGVDGAGESLYQNLVSGFDAALLTAAGREYQMAVPDPDGGPPRELLVGAARAIYQDRPVLLCALRDLTARIQLEERQERARIDAENASQAKTMFVATISHELRTPLHGILGHLELLARSNLDDAQQERLSRVTQSADALLATISDVLELSSIESGELGIDDATFEPAQMLERVAMLYAPLAMERSVDLDVSLAGCTGAVYRGAQGRIEQVLRNLVSNAVKFTLSGRIVLRAGVREHDGHTLLRVEVADSGIGLSAEQCVRLFEPYVQADASIRKRFGGSGLGLWLCQQLVERMGGCIAVKSTPGVGSVFHFEVPVQRVAAASPDYPLAGMRLALVSRSANWRVELLRRLEAWGAQVAVRAEADQAAEEPAMPTDAVVVFERSATALSLPAAHRPLAQVVRVRTDGPLTAQAHPDGWCVSCYASDALLHVLRGVGGRFPVAGDGSR